MKLLICKLHEYILQSLLFFSLTLKHTLAYSRISTNPLLSESSSLIISSTALPSIASPSYVMAHRNSDTTIVPSLCESNIFIASISSSIVSGSMIFLSTISLTSLRLINPTLPQSYFSVQPSISLPVGLNCSHLSILVRSKKLMSPSLSLSKKSNTSSISSFFSSVRFLYLGAASTSNSSGRSWILPSSFSQSPFSLILKNILLYYL